LISGPGAVLVVHDTASVKQGHYLKQGH
jgi:hypothetical protein